MDLEKQQNRKVLLADDEPMILEELLKILTPTQDNTELNELQGRLFGKSGSKSKSSVSYDVCCCRQGDEAVRRVEEAIKQNSPFAVAFLDVRMPPGPDGVATAEQIRKLDPNIQIVIMTGYSDFDVREIAKRIPPEDKLLYLQKPVHAQEITQFALALTAKWQSDYLLHQQNKILAENNRMLREHIEHRKQVEKTLIKAKKLAEEMNETKSQFLANMSHEIRTPMNSIIGFSDILLDEELNADHKDYVGMISDNGRHLLCLINDILDFSKIQANKMDVEMIEFPLEKIVSKITSVASLKAQEKQLDFKINTCSDLPEKILTDPTRLTQCLVNLVNNAIKFTETGHVYLNISVEDRDGTSWVRFDVEDTGCGIPAEKQEKIFESFTQADGSTTRKFGGTGLGLTITRKLVELMGGTLSLTSQLGKGTVFTFSLPAQSLSDKTSQPAVATSTAN